SNRAGSAKAREERFRVSAISPKDGCMLRTTANWQSRAQQDRIPTEPDHQVSLCGKSAERSSAGFFSTVPACQSLGLAIVNDLLIQTIRASVVGAAFGGDMCKG